MSRSALLPAALAALTAVGAQAQMTSCSSDGQLQPTALLERFVSADCEACWRAPDTREARPGELVVDWIVPGTRGDDAPLSAAASRDAPARLQALRRQPPAKQEAASTVRQGHATALRVAIGPAFNDYVGASIEAVGGVPGPHTAWLALVETLPAGTEGSPVARNLVRNVLQVGWPSLAAPRSETRPMSIPEGARPERLRVIGWLQDSRGQIRAISESRCEPDEQKR